MLAKIVPSEYFIVIVADDLLLNSNFHPVVRVVASGSTIENPVAVPVNTCTNVDVTVRVSVPLLVVGVVERYGELVP